MAIGDAIARRIKTGGLCPEAVEALLEDFARGVPRARLVTRYGVSAHVVGQIIEAAAGVLAYVPARLRQTTETPS